MRQAVLVTYEGIYSLPLVEAFLNNPNVEVVKILRSGTIYANRTGLDGVWFLLSKSSLFFIVPKFIENLLFHAYRLFLPVSKRPFKTLEELSLQYGVEVETVGDINAYPHHQHTGMILFSSYFNQLFSYESLSRYSAAYNIHPAPLPVGRGLFSQFWLLQNRYETDRYYQTIHEMTDRIDAGQVVMQRSVAANLDSPSMADYMNKVTILGIEMMSRFDFTRQKNVHVPGAQSYYSFPRFRDVFRFWRSGLRFMRLRDIGNYFKMGDNR